MTGACGSASTVTEAITLTNQIGPEHLHIISRNPELIAERIENAGAIFLGPFTPVALGDYVAGPSHVLPTGGTARFASGLTANDFLRRSSVIAFSRGGLECVADDVRLLARKEGLTAHAASIDASQLSIQVQFVDRVAGTVSSWDTVSHPPTATDTYKNTVTNRVRVTVTYQWVSGTALFGPLTLQSTSEMPMWY